MDQSLMRGLKSVGAGAFLLMASACGPALATDCVEDRRTVKFADGQATKLRSYRCDVAGGRLNVEFHRLTDNLASVLLDGRALDGVSPVFSKFSVVDTPVQRSFKRLQDAGSVVRQVDKDDVVLELVAPGQVANETNSVDSRSSFRVRQISWSGEYVEMPAPLTDVRAIIDGTLPKGVNLYSYSLDRYSPNSVTYWRSLRGQDVEDYALNLERYVKFFRLPSDFRDAFTAPPEMLVDFTRAMGARIPIGLASIDIQKGGGGCNDWGELSDQLERSYFASVELPTVLIDTMLIQNSTSKEVTVGSLLGVFDNDESVRAFAAGDRAKMDKLAVGPLNIAPGSSALVALGIVLASGGADSPRNLSAQEKTIASRYARNHGVDMSRFQEPIRKRFSYGSKLSVNGLEVAGRRLTLAGRSANYAALNIGLEGSCPYLSTWNAADGWVEHGKILHRSSAPELEARETHSYEGYVARIRLDEREAERAVIRSVEAFLHLDDRMVPAAVAQAGQHSWSGEFALNWGDRIELEVLLPEGVAAENVRRTDIVAQGYYERYTAIATAIAARDPGNGIPATSMYRRNPQCAIADTD